jgi:hypothetical protein
MLKSLLRKIAGLKQKVQKGSNYDKTNLSDDVRARSPLVKSIVDRNARIFVQQILGEDIAVMPEDYDTNQKSVLAVQEFVFTSVSANPAANLLLIEIIAGDEESIEVLDNKISITTEDEVSDHDSIKALIDGDSQAASLITVEINSGEGSTLVDAEELASFSGAIG